MKRKLSNPLRLLTITTGVFWGTPVVAQEEKTWNISPRQGGTFFGEVVPNLNVDYGFRIFDVCFDTAFTVGGPVDGIDDIWNRRFRLSRVTVEDTTCKDTFLLGPMTQDILWNTVVLTGGMRLIDLEIVSEYGLWGRGIEDFAVAVKNTGENAKGWWYWTGVTERQIENVLYENNARPIDLEPVGTTQDNQEFLYDVLVISNTRQDHRAFRMDVRKTPAEIQYLVQSNPDMRIIHLGYEGANSVPPTTVT